jgi:hypothetical protein
MQMYKENDSKVAKIGQELFIMKKKAVNWLADGSF